MVKSPVLSQELKALLDYIKKDVVKEFPINEITPNYLMLAILNSHACEAYQVLSKLMVSNTMDDFKNYITDSVLNDCQNKPYTGSKECVFSHEYTDIAEKIANEGKTVTSSLLMDNMIVNGDNTLLKKLQSIGVTKEQLSDVVMAVSNTNKNISKHIPKPVKKKTHNTLKNNPASGYMPNIKTIPEENNSVETNCTNLVRNASKGMYDYIVGYEDIVREIFDVAGKYDRNIVAITGENGVGKTSVVYRMAKMIYDNECPKFFANKYIMEFGDTINNVLINDMSRIGKYIAFMDDANKLFLNKESEANNIFVLTELFKTKNLPVIIAMNDACYMKNIDSKPYLSRYIHRIRVNEPVQEKLAEIIRSGCTPIMEYNNVIMDNQSINEAIRLSKMFSQNEKSPKSTLNLIDYACSHVRMNVTDSDYLISLKSELASVLDEKSKIPNSGTSDDYDYNDILIRNEIEIKKKIEHTENELYSKPITMTMNNIRESASVMYGIPVNDIGNDERSRLKNLYSNLTEHVIGQNEAVEYVCKAVKRQRVGLSNPDKPCVMLLVGKSGTGKSFLAKRLAYEMFGSEKSMVRLDMSEYSDKTSVTKLYGSSSGYVGYEDGGVLTEAVKNNPRCVLLLDEIEKAHSDVYNVFLQVFDEGRLTDNKGNSVDFRNAIIIMTSNVGVKDVADKCGSIGFGKTDECEENKEIILKAIKKEFKPEFINRIDNICYFNELTDDNIRTIITNEIKKVKDRVMALGYDLDESIMSGRLTDTIFENVRNESEYGARPVLREIQKQLEDKLTDYIIDNDIEPGFVFKYNDIY